MKAGRIALSPMLLREWLHLPTGAVIRDVKMSLEGDLVHVGVEHDALPDCGEQRSLMTLPVVQPEWKDYHGRLLFVRWRQ